MLLKPYVGGSRLGKVGYFTLYIVIVAEKCKVYNNLNNLHQNWHEIRSLPYKTLQTLHVNY
jgi:hypothetical protein